MSNVIDINQRLFEKRMKDLGLNVIYYDHKALTEGEVNDFTQQIIDALRNKFDG